MKEIFLALFFSSVCFANDVKGNFTKVGDATHLEFSGRNSWNYNLRRDEGKVIVNLPPLDSQTKAHMLAWKDALVTEVTIAAGPDGGDEITFHTQLNVESFDYLTDQPSRLVLDFFKTDKPAVAKAKPIPVKKPKRREVATVKSVDEAPVESKGMQGSYDAADPSYGRFNVLENDIREESIIVSRNNIYLYYPIYNYPTPVLKDMLEAPPIYEIKSEDTDENKKARLLLTLFNKKRPAVFLKTLDFFNKQYPKSKYDEIVRYMEADVYFGFYQESKNPLDLEKAATRYQQVVELYPDSPLSERTTLFIAYSYFERGDFLGTMKVLTRFENRFPNSKWIPQVRLTLADTHKSTNHHDDALKELEELENDPVQNEFSVIAAYKKGDVYYSLKEYGKAITEYKKYLQKYPAMSSNFPNAYFNMAEAYFWMGQYKVALDTHRQFIRLFPKDTYGGYAITRIGEILEILGAPKKLVDGAYLESIFRFQGSEGASVAKVRMTSERMARMKDKELKVALEEANQFAENSKLARANEFVTILISDGYTKRKDYETALNLLVKFYKDNPTADLEVFKRRIRDNIIHQLHKYIAQNDFMSVFKLYGEYVAVWLKNSDRIDIEYYLARGFEMAGVQTEAAEYYRKVLNRLYAIQGTQEEKERRVLEDLPSTETVNLRLAAMTVAQKDFGKAAFYLESIKTPSKLKPEEQIERIELSSMVADERGQTDLAKKYLKDLIESWKGKPNLVSSPYLRLAELQMKDKEFESAAVNLEKILNLDTDSKQVPDSTVVRAMELKGDVAVESKNIPEAIKAYRKLLDRFEDSVPLEAVRYQLGKLQYENGNLIDAEKTWSALKGDSFWSKLAKEQLDNGKWNQQYKKYLNRIPAMANK